MSKMRIALIGCGNNMRSHVKRLLEIPEVEIVALAEPVEGSLQAMTAAFPQLTKLPRYDNHRTMLTQMKPAAVEISTPHTMHYEQIVDALNANAHVLVEKPMVCTTASAKHVCELAEQAGKVVLVSYQRHTQPIFVKMKQMIDAGELGDLEFITCLQTQDWYRRQLRGGGWRWRADLSGGGQLNDSGSHLVDIMLWVTGLEPESVFCAQQRFALEVDINSAMTMIFKGGVIGTMNIVGNAPLIDAQVWEDISIFGNKGALHYRMYAMCGHEPTLEFRRFDEDASVTVTDFPPASDPDRNFINAMLGREPVASPPLCGLRTIQLSEAAWKSAASGQAEPVES